MSDDVLDDTFYDALRNPPERRNEKDNAVSLLKLQGSATALAVPKRFRQDQKERNIIFSRLNTVKQLASLGQKLLRHVSTVARYKFHDMNDVLYSKDDSCDCWYILLSGSVFIQGSMFVPFHRFGKQIPGTKRRNCKCLVLEPSEMLAIDYPDLSIHGAAGGMSPRPHALRRTSGNSANDRVPVNNVIEADTSSSEGSPFRQKSNTLPKGSNGQMVLLNDIESQSSTSKDMDDYDDYSEPRDLDEEDSLSLHSSSSFQIKDLVIEVLKKDIGTRTVDDIEMLMEFTKSLVAFSNMTESVRKSLCKAMVFAWVEHAGTTVLKDNELLDSWSVIINGQVQVTKKVEGNKEERVLDMGETFGVCPTLDSQYHKGEMITLTDDCQFLCIPQPVYCNLVQLGRENIEFVPDEAGEVVMVKEKRENESGNRSGDILIRGTADSLTRYMLEENAMDSTYTEDFLLTYRAFIDNPLSICSKLLEWFDNDMFREKVSRIILLWVNNHFNDFESDSKMMDLLELFESKLTEKNLQQNSKLLGVACSTKAKPRVVSLTRPSSDVALEFEISGGSTQQGRHQPIYISTVVADSETQKKGVKRGDQLLDVNGQNFEKISYEGALTILNKNTELNLTLKTSLFAFKDMTSQHRLSRKNRKSKHHSLRDGRAATNNSSSDNEVFEMKHKKGGTMGRAARKFSRMFKKESNNFEEFVAIHGGATQGTVDDSFLTIPRKSHHNNAATIDLAARRSFRQSANLSHSNPDLLEISTVDFLNLPATDIPEDVIKVYNSDQSVRFIFVNEDTTAGDVVARVCKEFGITEELEDYALYRVSVQSETSVVKQSKLPDPWSKLAEIPLGARYYLKKTTYSDQLLPDENIPDLLKEANFSFLDLNCFEVALYLTREDYKLFQLTEPTNYIDDLFRRDTDLKHFRVFEDLVNRELFWVVTMICSELSSLYRSKIIKHFIKIAHHCKALKNFNSTFALISGLGYRAVTRMKQTWEKVPVKSTRLFEELQALMDPSRNMSKYRTLLNDYIHQPPVIPYIPVVKKDLTFLHLGNDTKVKGLINFEKMRMIAKEVRNIHHLCSADKSLIIPSATASQQKDTEKNAIYQTLVRRGRRASFNNLRKMYEDQMNVRRVRQYMKQLNIVTDEDKLMDMSKLAEPLAGSSSAQAKRRNTSSILTSDSPSRSSRTLPNQSGRSAPSANTSNLQLRNNSDPHLASIPSAGILGSKKKVPATTLPKYPSDLHSPQLISRKLMSLSEEAGAEEKKNRGKKGKETKRSASVSSHELSPSSSPYLPPKHNNVNKQQADSNHTVASENTNKNNNRMSLPTGEGPPVVRRAFPTHGSSASSCRSSIASASSLGTMSSSNPSTPSLTGSGYSPRSSPVSWGSNPSLTGASTKAHHHSSSNSPSRSASGSSTDTVKAAAGRLTSHDRPIIKQLRNSRSISYGGGSMAASSINERMFSQMSASSSSPALNTSRAQNMILPNHPRIPRTPSNDSGVLTASSLSVDSCRYTPTDESDLFPRPNHSHPHGHTTSSSRPHSGVNDPSSSRRTQHLRSSNVEQQRGSSPRQTSRPHPTGPEEDNIDKVEQTFLSGCRGSWDTPRPENKDPINSLAPAVAPAQHLPGKLPPTVLVHPGHVPPGSKPPQLYPPDKTVFGKGSVKGIHEFLVFKRQTSIHSHNHYRANMNSNNNNAYNPVMQPNYTKVVSTPNAMLEEMLLRELKTQKQNGYNARRPYPENMVNRINLKRLSLTESDSSINSPHIWGGYPASPLYFQSPDQPIKFVQHQHPSTPPYPTAPNQNFSPHYRPNSLTSSSSSSHRGLNHEEALMMSAYDKVKNSVFMPELSAIEITTTYNPNEVHNQTTYVMTPDECHQKQNSPFTQQHPPSPMRHREFPRENSPSAVNSNGHHAQYTENVTVHTRRKSQDWCETELDNTRQSPHMKAWGSSSSLPSTTTASRYVSQSSSDLPPRSLQPNLLLNHSPVKKENRPPPPPPPQRTSSRLQTGETNGISPSHIHQSNHLHDDESSFSNCHDDVTRIKANGHVPQVHPSVTHNSSSAVFPATKYDCRSLPSYNEALHQIQSKHALHTSPISNSYRSFATDNREKEQISQV